MGSSTLTAIKEFNLDDEILEVFRRKCEVGRFMHDNSRTIGGRSMNRWLSDPDSMGELLDALEKEGWIVRHQDPKKSRFWSLIHGPKARMFGVFSAYEQQIIYDWIAGDFAEGQINPKAPGGLDTGLELPENLRHPKSKAPATTEPGDFGTEGRKVEELLNNGIGHIG